MHLNARSFFKSILKVFKLIFDVFKAIIEVFKSTLEVFKLILQVFKSILDVSIEYLVIRKSDVRFALYANRMSDLLIKHHICVIRKSDVRFAVLRKSDETANRIQHIHKDMLLSFTILRIYLIKFSHIFTNQI